MINILIAGDFCPLYRVAKLIDENNFSEIFTQVVKLTDKADYSIVNLEAPVIEHQAKPIEKNGPNLKCSPASVDALKYANFDMVTLANNHIYDYGEIGIENTLKLLVKSKIDYVGADKNLQEAGKIFYKKIKQKTFAFINFCENEFSIATKNTAGANPLNIVANYYQIQEAKENSDYVIVIVHGGHEYYQLPSPRMKGSYRFFIDSGANVVVNHHQHCYSGYEEYNEGLIFYGLGNFCFDWEGKRNSIWNEGYMVALTFDNGKFGFELYPYCQCDEKPEVHLMDEREKKSFYSKLQELNAVIIDDKALIQNFNAFANTKRDDFRTIFQPYHNRAFNKLFRMKLLPDLIFRKKKKHQILNLINCEAHRDILLYNLNHKIE